jgi:L-amino acid N-acyltransferase YncA
VKKKINIDIMLPEHWPKVSKIYKEGILTGMATFEKEIPSWEDWDSNHLKVCRIIASVNGDIVGWAALSPVSSRCVYGGVGEVSVYVGQEFRGNRIGEKLLIKLISESEKNGLWTIQSGIFPENITSIKLHEKVGFRRIGYREKIGELNGIWKDNILLERRSKLV